MPDWGKFDDMWKKMEPVRKVFGLLKTPRGSGI